MFQKILSKWFFSWCGTNFSYTQACGCRKRGRNLKISAKNAVFLISRGKKQISPLLASRRKVLEKSTSAPGKIPSDAHAHKHVKLHHFVKNCVALHHLVKLFNNTNAVSNTQ